MTIDISPDGVVTIDYTTAARVADAILEGIKDQQVGYGMLACGIVLARLHNAGAKSDPAAEIQFTGDLMEWMGAYFAFPQGGNGTVN